MLMLSISGAELCMLILLKDKHFANCSPGYNLSYSIVLFSNGWCDDSEERPVQCRIIE